MTPIWIYWDQGWDMAPKVVNDCAESWEMKNPDYQVYRLSRETIADFVVIDDELQQLFRGLSVQCKTDILRLMLVQQYGGVWVDATLYCNKPLSQWLHLNKDHPVALFENPGPDRLVSSWFIAALPDNELIRMWLHEMRTFFRSMRNPRAASGFRKAIVKILQWRWRASPAVTLKWFGAVPHRVLSVWPYFICHYCYNRLALTNTDFQRLAHSRIGFPADPAHALQFALAGKRELTDYDAIPQAFVHKLNWRKLPTDTSIHTLISKLADEAQA